MNTQFGRLLSILFHSLLFPFWTIIYPIADSIRIIKNKKTELNTEYEYFGNIWLLFKWYDRPMKENLRLSIYGLKRKFKAALKTNRKIEEDNQRFKELIGKYQEKKSSN